MLHSLLKEPGFCLSMHDLSWAWPLLLIVHIREAQNTPWAHPPLRDILQFNRDPSEAPRKNNGQAETGTSWAYAESEWKLVAIHGRFQLSSSQNRRKREIECAIFWAECFTNWLLSAIVLAQQSCVS